MSLVAFALLVLLVSGFSAARSIRGLEYEREGRELKSVYVRRTFTVSINASLPPDSTKHSTCLVNAISSLVQTWSHVTFWNETLLAYSPPSFCKGGQSWITSTNWTFPSSFLTNVTLPLHRQLLLVRRRCTYYRCITSSLMFCRVCGRRQLDQSNGIGTLVVSRNSSDIYASLLHSVKSEVPRLCSEIQNITAVNVTLDDIALADSYDTLESSSGSSNWSTYNFNSTLVN